MYTFKGLRIREKRNRNVEDTWEEERVREGYRVSSQDVDVRAMILEREFGNVTIVLTICIRN